MHFHGKSKQWAWVGSPDSLRNPSSFRLAFHKLPSPNKRHNSPHNSNIPATKTFFPSPTVLNIPTCYPIWSHLFLTFSWKNFIVGFLWVLPSYKQESWGSCVCVCVWSVMSTSLPSHGLASHQTPLSMELSSQEYWSGLRFPTSGDLPDPGIEPASLASPPLALSITAPHGKLQGKAHRGSVTHLRSQPLDGVTCSCPYPTIFDLETDNSIRFKWIVSGRTRIHSIWLIQEQITPENCTDSPWRFVSFSIYHSCL